VGGGVQEPPSVQLEHDRRMDRTRLEQLVGKRSSELGHGRIERAAEHWQSAD
jgi:hypothetical protein